MKNTWGNALTVTLFGESHGPAIGAVLDGLAPGIPVDEDRIRRELARRRPGALGSARREADLFRIESGVFRGYTTGTPVCLLIPNEDTDDTPYEASRGIARPGHADYTAFCKYHGFEDYRGGGHFSGRLTAALVAAGALLLPALERKQIGIGTHLASCAGIADRSFEDYSEEIRSLQKADFPVLDSVAAAQMQQAVAAAAADRDSVGGITETAVVGLPAGLGEPWFDSIESLLSHALFSIPAVKAVSFGDGFAIAGRRGHDAQDALCFREGTLSCPTHHAGGVDGGLTNGLPLLVQCAIKPTPSIGREQETINFLTGENTTFAAAGRHDPCIALRACPIMDAVCALVLADLLTMRYGTDYLGETSL